MKFSLLFALAVVLSATPVAAQNQIDLHPDADRASCAISEPLMPPIVQVHVFLTGPTSSTGVRFTAPKPECWVGATWLGDALVPGMGTMGSSQTDWSVGFGVCAPAPVYIGAISYLISGQALPCCEVRALPAGQFAFTDCAFFEYELTEGKPMIVNPDESCGCQGGIFLATNKVTWGKVKALYRD